VSLSNFSQDGSRAHRPKNNQRLLANFRYRMNENVETGVFRTHAQADSELPRTSPALILEPQLQVEAMPLSVWLDFKRRAANRWIPSDLPDWLESVTADIVFKGGTATTTFRLHFRGLGARGQEMQLRVFFDDLKDVAPTIAGWSDAGASRFTHGPVGDGLGLPNSETLTFPTAGVDWVDVSVPGDGRTVRGAFLTLLAAQTVQRGADFAPLADVADIFGNLPPTILPADDLALFGRIKAVIDPGGLILSRQAAICGTWEFPLESPPLLAVITFEVLNADALAPLEVILNNRPLGPVAAHWPDLADPGYLGLSRSLEKDMRFRYTGWLRCQKVIPGSALRAGANSLVMQLHPDSGPLAVRAVELELKYNWKNLDYDLAPALP